MNQMNNKQQSASNQSDRRTGETKSARAPAEAMKPPPTQVSREERIRLAAYATAEQRGFEPGFETEDWLIAEKQIDLEDEVGMSRDSAS